MQTAVGQMFVEGLPRAAMAHDICNLKATHKALAQDGHWKEAWKHTYLPHLSEVSSGVGVAGRATAGRHLREQAALNGALEKARKEAAETKTRKKK